MLNLILPSEKQPDHLLSKGSSTQDVWKGEEGRNQIATTETWDAVTRYSGVS